MYKLKKAIEVGYIVQGWVLEDYIRDAINNKGWESLVFWAPKGSLKSNLEMQLLYMTYGKWELVHKYMIMDPLEYVAIMESVKEQERLPLLVWDDITTHLPSSLYFQDRDLYIAIKRYWPVTRSRFNCFLCSAPLKDDILDFMLGDMMGELFFYRRVGGATTGKFDFQRHCWYPDYENPKKAKFEMVRVELSEFPMTPNEADQVYKQECEQAAKEDRVPRPKLPGVPYEEFLKYWEKRMRLAKTADDNLMDEFRRLMKEATPPPEPTSEEELAITVQARNLVNRRWAKHRAR